MFYILNKADGGWFKCHTNGIPLKCNADFTLQEFRDQYPSRAFRLIYSEEEL